MRAIPLPDGDLHHAPDFLAPDEADQFMRQLLDGIEWQQHHVVIFGRQHPAPRLSAWHGGVALGRAGQVDRCFGENQRALGHANQVGGLLGRDGDG